VLGAVEHAAHEHALDHRPEHYAGRQRHQQVVPESGGIAARQGKQEVRAQDEERAVGEVHDAQRTKNQRQPHRQQKQRGRRGQPGHELKKEEG